MANKTLIIAKREFLATVKRKGFLFGTLLMPLLFALPLLFAKFIPSLMAPEGGAEKIGFVDDSGFLEGNQEFIEYPHAEAAKEALMRGDIAFFFEITEDYLGNDGKITTYSKKKSFLDPGPTSAIQDFLTKNLLSYAEVEESIAEKIENRPAIDEVLMDPQGNKKDGSTGDANTMLTFALSVLLLFSILTSSGYLMEGIGEEKESKTGELLLSSVSAGQLLKGKILGYGAAGLLQMGAWTLLGLVAIFIASLQAWLAGVTLSWTVGLSLAYFVLGHFLFATSIACAASVSSTAKEAQQTSMVFSMFAILPLMFSSLLMMNPQSGFAQFLTYFPYTAPFVSMMRFALDEISFVEIAISLAILILSILLLTHLSGRIFRMGMLMYGKKANVREIIGFLKQRQ